MTESGRDKSSQGEAWPEHLLALASEYACVIDAEGAIRAVNPRWHLPQRAATLFEWFDPADHAHIRAAIDSAPHASDGGTARAHLVPGDTPCEVRIGLIDREFLLVTLLPVEPPGLLANCIVRSAGAGLAVMDEDGRYVYVNDAYCETYGHAREDLLGNVFTMVLAPGTEAAAMDNHRATIETGQPLTRELEVRRGDGSRMIIDTTSRRIELPDGRVMRLATVLDITELRANEERLAEAESRLRDFTDSLPGAVYQFRHEPDGSHRFTYLSHGLHRIGGFPADYPLDDFGAFLELVEEADREPLQKAILTSEQNLEPLLEKFRLHTPAGTLWVEARSTPTLAADGTVVCNGFLDDITEGEAARQILADERNLFDEIVRTSLSGLVITDLEGRIVHANPSGAAILRLDDTPDQSLSNLPIRLTAADDAQLAPHELPIPRVLAADGPIEDMRFALHHEDGTRQIIAVNASPVRDGHGEIARIVFSFADLTREVETRNQLEQQVSLFDAIFRDSSETLIVTGTDRRMRMVNPAFTDMLGYSEEEVIGQHTTMIYADMEDHRRIGESYSERVAGREAGTRTHLVRLRGRDGREFFAESVTDVLHDAAGNPLGYVGLLRDVSARKAAEEELERQRELYARLVESTSAILWEADPETFAFTFVSGKSEELLGYTPEDWTSDPEFWPKHMHPEDREWAPGYCGEATARLEGHTFDYRMIAADGRTVWLRDIVTVVAENDRPKKLVGVMIDITETKQAEQELARSEARYRTLYHRTPVMLHSIDREGRLIAVSGYWLENLGYTEGEVLGRPSSDFLTEESARHAREDILPEFFRTGHCQNVSYQIVRADGTIIDVLLSAVAEYDSAGEIEHSLAVMTDVTEQRRAEMQYRDLFNNASEGIYRSTQEGRLLRTNPALVRMHGYETEQELIDAVEHLGEQWYVNPADREEIVKRLRRDGSVEHFECEIYRCATGERIWVSENARAVHDDNGEVLYFEGTVVDISSRVRKDRELVRSEARFRTLYQNTPVMLFSTDAEGSIIDINEFWLAQLGYGRDEVIGRSILDFFTHASRARAEREYLPQLRQEGTIEEQEYRMRRKDGEIRDILISSSTLEHDEDGVEGVLSVITDVTERRRLEAEYRDIFDNSSEGMYRSTPSGKLLRANPALARMQGFESPEDLLAAVDDLSTDWYVDPNARDRMENMLHTHGYVDGFEAEVRPLNADGRLWTSETVHVTRNARGEILYYEGTVRDITNQYKAREMTRYRNTVLEMIARDDPVTGIMYEIVGISEQQQERLTAAIFLLRHGRLYSAAAPGLSNSCIEAVDGATPSELGGTILEALHSDHEVVEPDLYALPAGENDFVDAMTGSGYGAIMVMPVRDQEGTVLGVLAGFAKDARILDRNCTDMLREMAQITSIAIEQHRLSEALMRQAQYDPLTELPNRALLSDRLERAVRDAERAGHNVGVILLDLDEFKLVNDSLGHSAGDELLKEVAGRLQSCLRGGDTVARLGGDEFVLVVPLQHGSEYCTDIAERVLRSLQKTVCVSDQEIAARPSMGISIYPQDGRTPEALLKAADTAMYAAKNAGKNQYHYFAENMNRTVSDRLEIESELHDAIRDGHLELHYQPRVSLATGRISGAEGLLRWHHPRRGLLLPGAFIEVAERSPLIGDIDRLVIEQALNQIAALQRDGHRLIMSVNLSAGELHADGLAVQIAHLLEEAGVDPSGLELEITESMLMRDFERASAQLLDLKERAPGLRIAIDDFGSGYSSLNYLRHLPVDTLKIDRSFVVGLVEGDDTAAAIAKTIVELAHNLNMTVVGEGVESGEQARLLRRFGCEEAQGFLFDPALPIEELRARLKTPDTYANRASDTNGDGD